MTVTIRTPIRRRVWALFVQFAETPLAPLTDGWVYQGMFHDELALNRATAAVDQDMQATAGKTGMRTVTYKVVELS